MHVIARIPVGGYAPGQLIDVEIEVTNRSEESAAFSIQMIKVFLVWIILRICYINYSYKNLKFTDVGNNIPYPYEQC